MGKTTLTVDETTHERFRKLKRNLNDVQDAPDHTTDTFLSALMDTWDQVGRVPEDGPDGLTDALREDEVAIVGTKASLVDELATRLEQATGDGATDTAALAELHEALATVEERTGRIERLLEDMGGRR